MAVFIKFLHFAKLLVLNLCDHLLKGAHVLVQVTTTWPKHTHMGISLMYMIYFHAHALNDSSACVNFMMYLLLVLTFAFCFERKRLFLSSACVNFMMYRLLVLTFAFCFERIRLFLLTKLSVYHTYTSILTRMRCVIQAHASIL